MQDIYSFEFYKKSADFILEQIGEKVELALILGSSLGSLADEINNQSIISYNDIPNFLKTTVKSHAGKLIVGDLAGKRVACMSGRFHYYEGYDFEQLSIPIRVLKLIGAETVILTNAAGAVNTSYNVGDIMLISDQIKLAGASPMRGRNIEEFGDRFFDVSDVYNKSLRDLAKDVAKKLDIKLQEGVYFYCSGPQFETPAEIRAIRVLGGDAVGMSTVTEALTAAHCGMKVLGLSLMTNMAAGVVKRKLTSEEVSVTAAKQAETFKLLIREIVKAME